MTSRGDAGLFHIPTDSVTLEAMRGIADRSEGIVLFAHGSGSSRHSPRNNQVARALQDAGIATLLLDLLTEREAASRVNVCDVDFLAERLAAATDCVRGHPGTLAQVVRLAIDWYRRHLATAPRRS